MVANEVKEAKDAVKGARPVCTAEARPARWRAGAEDAENRPRGKAGGGIEGGRRGRAGLIPAPRHGENAGEKREREVRATKYREERRVSGWRAEEDAKESCGGAWMC